MVFNQLLRRSLPLARNITTSAVRSGHHDTRGIPGSNLPFPVDNKYKLLALFMLYFGSGISLPFLTLRHLLLKKNQ